MSGVLRVLLPVLLVGCLIGCPLGLALIMISNANGLKRRLSCANNLSQIARAVEDYRETYGTYPIGTIPNSELPAQKRLSWLVALLPFMERSDLYDGIPKDRACDDEGNSTISSSYVKTYACTAGRYDFCVGLTQPAEYVGIAGVGADSAELPANDPRIGLFGYSRKIKKEDIRDGLSSTLLAIETSIDIGPWAAGGPSTVQGIESDRSPYVGPDRQFGGNHKTELGFFKWIRHDCATAAFVDGSIHFLNDSISRETLEALATIAGGDTPGNDY